jgi:hypothetical protein
MRIAASCNACMHAYPTRAPLCTAWHAAGVSHFVVYLPISGAASQSGQFLQSKQQGSQRRDSKIPSMRAGAHRHTELGNLASWDCTLARSRLRRYDGADGACLTRALCGPMASTRQAPSGSRWAALPSITHSCSGRGALNPRTCCTASPVAPSSGPVPELVAGALAAVEAPRRLGGAQVLQVFLHLLFRHFAPLANWV